MAIHGQIQGRCGGWSSCDIRRRQLLQCSEQTSFGTSFYFVPSLSICKISPIIYIFVTILLVLSTTEADQLLATNQTFRPHGQLKKLRWIQDRLKQINKPSLRTIQSPDGDLIDCVVSHRQPAFDHPRLHGTKPLDPPEAPKGHRLTSKFSPDSFQLWTIGGETCPPGTIAIRRIKKKDMLRANSYQRFGRKRRTATRAIQIDAATTSSSHEHAVGYVLGEEYYGAKANINVWAPLVNESSEFSLSQMWVISGTFGDDLNTIEAGWQVSPELYGDNYPRFFTYWTTDAYQATGCYNLLCSGFVQTNSKIAIGAAISPSSQYNGGQFDISLLVWKDPKHGNWWLEFGNGQLVGYWPSFLFTHLADHATMVQFGGEIVNNNPSGSHTSTQMGSGHFAGEGFGKASYFRNLQVVDWDNNLVPVSDIELLADHSGCYDIKGGVNSVWGNYFYYGGPGLNDKCP